MSVDPTTLRTTKNQFARNVAIVAIGTAGAQAIAMAFAPIITRQYGPEAFGILGTFMAIVAVMAPLAALSYPIAIVLPKNDVDALGIARLSLGIAVVTASLAYLALLSFSDVIVEALNLEGLAGFIQFVPVAMFFTACLAVISQWVIRKRLYKLKAKVAVAQAIVVNGVTAGVGILSPTALVLIAVATLGHALHALVLAILTRLIRAANSKNKVEHLTLRVLAKRYVDFPIYRAPQNFINAISVGLPVVLLASFFGPAAAGYYALARMVMSLPGNLIAQSVGEVFYPRIAEAHHRGENQRNLIVSTTVWLATVGVVPFATIFVVGPWIFGFVFGSEWAVSGEYARWLSLMLFFNFINRPSVAAVPVLGLQRGLVIYEIFSTTTKILALYLGFKIFGSDLVAVALFGIFGAIAYMVLIAWVIATAGHVGGGTGHASEAGR